ncbi:MAG: hypothetical protein WBA51_08595 [Erythrobacter sp.]
MTRQSPHFNAVLQLDADEVLALRENLQAAITYYDGPPARKVPETLCAEIDQLLRLIELDIRSSHNGRSPQQ